MYPDPALFAAIGAALLAGFVGGFSGFGAAMVFMPIASAAVGPRDAAAAFLVLNFVLTIPLVVNAVRICRWRTVLPAVIAAAATVPLGAFILAEADPLVLRWCLSGLVLVLLGLVASGARYRGEPHLAASLGVGSASGVLAGIAQVGGPPVIAFWMSGPYPAAVIRANLLSFFALASFATFAAYAWNGLFHWQVGRLILVFTPTYALGLVLGARVFRRATDRSYRGLAYAIIAAAALLSLPLLDPWLR